MNPIGGSIAGAEAVWYPQARRRYHTGGRKVQDHTEIHAPVYVKIFVRYAASMTFGELMEMAAAAAGEMPGDARAGAAAPPDAAASSPDVDNDHQ